MAYYELNFDGQTDATGAATVRLGPLPDKHLWFLGYAVITFPSGAACTVIVQSQQGNPIGAASGLVPVAGPFQLKPGEYKVLVISGGPASQRFLGNLIGDIAKTTDELLVRPTPTQASASSLTGLPKSASINFNAGASTTTHLLAATAGRTYTLYWVAAMLFAAGVVGVNLVTTTGIIIVGWATGAPINTYLSAPPVSWPFGLQLPVGVGVDVVNGGVAYSINGAIVYTQAGL